MTSTPSPAPLSAEAVAGFVEMIDNDHLTLFSADDVLGLLATLTARDEIIAGLTRERDGLYFENANYLSQAVSSLARAETAESRVKVLEEALRPFAAFAEGLHKAIPDGIPMTQGSPMARKQLTAGDLRRAASALTPSDQV